MRRKKGIQGEEPCQRSRITSSSTFWMQRFLLVVFIIVFSLWSPPLSSAGKLGLSWNANTESDLGGYKVYYGTASRTYSSTVNVGNIVSYQLEGLTEGRTYYLTLTAYDKAGNESGFSNEVAATVPSLSKAIRVNAGGSVYTDGSNNLWAADQPYKVGGWGYWGYWGGKASKTSDPIANTVDDPLYQSERYGLKGYRFDLGNGRYQVKLLFAEISLTKAGRRVFDVYLEGARVLARYDIYAQVGHDVATSQSFTVDVKDWQLNLNFISLVGLPKVSAIEVVPLAVPAIMAKGDNESQEGEVSGKDNRISSLYFQPMVPGKAWIAHMSLWNEGTEDAEVILKAYNRTGNPLKAISKVTSLAAGEKITGPLSRFFKGPLPSGFSYIRAESGGKIGGSVTVKSAKGGQIAVLPTTRSGASTLYFPYAAAEQMGWTGLSMLNVGAGEASITSIAQDAAGNSLASHASTLPLGAQAVGLLEEHFAGSLPPETAWIQVISDQKLTGVELFGPAGGRSLTGLAAVSSGASTIYFPYVISGQDAETEVTLLNVGSQRAEVTMTAYDREGRPLGMASEMRALEAGERRSKRAAEYFGGELPPGTAWMKGETDGQLIGFALVAPTAGGKGRTVLPALAPSGSADLYIPLDHPSSQHTRIVLLNPGAEAVSVALTAHDRKGKALGATPWITALQPGERVADTAAGLFGGSLPAGTSSLRVKTSGPILGLELLDDPKGRSLAGRTLGTQER